MKTTRYGLVCIATLLLLACEPNELLERQPLDKPSDATFFTNETELKLALNACYRHLTRTRGDGTDKVNQDCISDIGFDRTTNAYHAIANGNIDPQNSEITGFWQFYYVGISKTNNLLANMDKARDKVSAALFERMKAEARVIRALAYLELSQKFGDVPLLTKPEDASYYLTLKRNPKEEVYAFVAAELAAAAPVLPVKYAGDDLGRITRGAALTLKARAALYNKKYEAAREAAKAIMDLNAYKLHPSYRDLFTYKGEGSEEVILDYQFTRGVQTHALPKYTLTRMAVPNGFSIYVPSQDLVDSYECTDGKPITESPLYNPTNPFTNRDPRLAASIILPRVGSATATTTPGTVWQGYEYKTGRDIPGEEFYEIGARRIANQDITNQFASFTGYCWLKYLDPSDSPLPTESELNFILARYAEVLLIYAEAKIELGQIDASVLAALNQVRARAYGSGNPYPAVTTTNVAELRTVLRRERKVELALEGFRYDDIRRWGIAEKAMGRTVYGRPKDFTKMTTAPKMDKDGLLDYSGQASQLRFIETNVFKPNGYLWPVPQRELDLNKALGQNPGY